MQSDLIAPIIVYIRAPSKQLTLSLTMPPDTMSLALLLGLLSLIVISRGQTMSQFDVHLMVNDVLTKEFSEPIYFPKGKNKILVQNYQVCKPSAESALDMEVVHRLSAAANGRKVRLEQINIPNLDFLLGLPQEESFSIFLPRHQQIASQLITLMLGFQGSRSKLATFLACVRDVANRGLFVYAISVANEHLREDSKLSLPSLVHIFPENFIRGNLLQLARVQSTNNAVRNINQTEIEITNAFTASDVEPENWLSYFREDIALNLHHWHWHLLFPFHDAQFPDGSSLLYRDRRGELFLYMHQQIIARYNFERLSNRLAVVKPLENFLAPIQEGYFSKLNRVNSNGAWPGRPRNIHLGDINPSMPNFQESVHTLTRWKNRILDAIADMKVKHVNGTLTRLTADILGNLLEASDLSVNPGFYGTLHNNMHVFTSKAHDPDGRFLEGGGVMGDTSTAMRDPVFYRVHGLVDNIYNKYKKLLPPYTKQELGFAGIVVNSFDVVTKSSISSEVVLNAFETFWEAGKIKLGQGLDFHEPHDILVKYSRLQHSPYTLKIKVNNTKARTVSATVRIFLAPRYSDRELEWSFSEQRNMFIELDKFVVPLVSGVNSIVRESSDSSVAIEYPAVIDGEPAENRTQCGWPMHLLIPKGIPGGFSAQLLVVLTDYELDRPSLIQRIKSNAEKAVPSYCGLKDAKYPDARPMGFPLDRLLPPNGNDTLHAFLTPNMATSDVLIVHKNVFLTLDGGLKQGINYDSLPSVKSTSGTVKNHIFVVNNAKYLFSLSAPANFSLMETWEKAKIECKKIGMDLARFRSIKQLSDVTNIMRSKWMSPKTLNGKRIERFSYWTSAKWVAGNGLSTSSVYDHISDKFEWTSGGDAAFNFNVIKSEQPGTCVNVYFSKSLFNFWANDCNRKFEFLCSDNKDAI